MKRRKLLQIEIENPERRLYCLALIIAGEQVNKGCNHAATILRNVASYMEVDSPDTFVASCLSRSGFGLSDRVDLVNKLGHLERLCESVFDHFGDPLPDYQACEGYHPVNAVFHKIQQGNLPPLEKTADGSNFKSEWR